ncbi:retrovirus-related Pol polyprotein from transposon 412 [Nephila pilipes]|uniref:Retrovirus-related Pol polyprotein from transposon 412 n=1 Tax=Nephila pilipes TaxID=299642 RepID=A0A8X6NDR8_NEPPI|nr:retrovirus-related Pol polyprotein from transposon 412 [Nephila pilipes]
MLYGRRPTSTLSILKDFWTKGIPVPIGQLKSVKNYLNDLKIKLQLAAEQADDKVVVLAPDSTHKMYGRWTSCTIVEKRRAHSYLVQMRDNSVKHIHTNKIRKLNIQTNNTGVIYETDIDFGDIENTSVTKHTPTKETYIKKHLISSRLNSD